MSRRAARCTEADLNRALKAAARQPEPMAVEVTPEGTIRIVPVEHSHEKTGVEPVPVKDPYAEVSV